MRRKFEIEPVEKQSVVEVVRYFRRWDVKNDQISSRGGVTCICVLDYDKLILTIYPAICSMEDNFDKEVGFNIASVNRDYNNGITMKFNPNAPIFTNIQRHTELFPTKGCDKTLLKHFKDQFKSAGNCLSVF